MTVRDETRRAAAVAVRCLPARRRAALLLCTVARLSAAEAAVALGTTPAAVNSALQRARGTLAALGTGEVSVPVPVADRRCAQAAAAYADAVSRCDIAALIALAERDADAERPSP